MSHYTIQPNESFDEEDLENPRFKPQMQNYVQERSTLKPPEHGDSTLDLNN